MKTPLKVAALALVVLTGCYMLLPGASEAGQPGQYKTAYGVVVYLGVKPARVIKAQPQTYPELHARGTIPRGRNDHYVSVALFKSSSGERISDAQVSARVSPIGLAGRERDLKPIPIGGAVTYGNFFRLSSPDTYVIGVVIRQTKDGDPIQARFEYRYYPSER